VRNSAGHKRRGGERAAFLNHFFRYILDTFSARVKACYEGGPYYKTVLIKRSADLLGYEYKNGNLNSPQLSF
jgi:hypothetical protein